MIAEQGSFAVGGIVLKSSGTFNPQKPTAEGQTFRGTTLMFFIRFL
ncbi:hypothetical protein IC610_01400 [Chryseobacterium sp. GCR10]|uniref:Uncharacterized protein n=1 Tax=Chryseobacterium caseinilyticum TaxID=2771428 RepID=A0ABR8Z8H3_9FLAO|nr:hypothetical protein [Chryseobacterium caseinilyticum]